MAVLPSVIMFTSSRRCRLRVEDESRDVARDWFSRAITYEPIGPVIIGTDAGTARSRPSLNRVFQQTDVLKVVYGLLVPSRVVAITTVEIIDANGRPVVTERRDVGGGARDLTELSLPLSSLRPGQYRLRISVAGGSPARELGFVVAVASNTTQ